MFSFSKEFNDFIAACLVKDPDDRPDARTLLSHPFVSGQQSPKHIIALLIEYQADVVEEDVELEDHVSALHGYGTSVPKPLVTSRIPCCLFF